MSRALQCLCLAWFGLVLTGCGGGPEEKVIEIKVLPPLERAKQLLESYTKGNPVASEAAGYSDLVDAVRQSDPAKADILDRGFKDLLKSPQGAVATKAREILKKL